MPGVSKELDAPVHNDEKPEFITPETTNKSEIKLPQAPTKKVIEVVATRKGFYNQNRIKEGEKFNLRSEAEFGEWFKCINPVLEKKRQEFLKNKKAKGKGKL